MFGKTETSAIVGIDGRSVYVEADYGDGLPSFEMVGFLGAEVKEAKERVKAALRNSGIFVNPGRLTVSLSPADLRKQGNGFDLPIAVAIMVAVGVLPQELAEGYIYFGELSLDGKLRPVHGALSHVLLARETGKKGCIVPRENARECAFFPDLPIYAFDSLSEVFTFLLNPSEGFREDTREEACEAPAFTVDFSEILGQESVKRAAEVASAGMHGFLMIGPPGTGKTLSARRIPTILPPLTDKETLECTKIYSVAGLLGGEEGLVKMRPFRSPHHTISANGLVGGGTVPRPGEMSLAHNGVLFLDELPEFSKMTLEVMRQPLEDRQVVISRVQGSTVFPTNVMLVAAMNPCKCGYYPDRNRCHCSETEVRRYLSGISKPLLDRIDISVEVPRISAEEFRNIRPGTDSKTMRERVMKAWEIERERYKELGILFNSQLSGGLIRKYCKLGKAESEFLSTVFDSLNLSVRAHDRILKVARTIADLEGEPEILKRHLSEAVQYRILDRKFFNGPGT